MHTPRASLAPSGPHQPLTPGHRASPSEDVARDATLDSECPFPDLGTPAADVRRARMWDEGHKRDPEPAAEPFDFEAESWKYEQDFPEVAKYLRERAEGLASTAKTRRQWGPIGQRQLRRMYELDPVFSDSVECVSNDWEDAADRNVFDFDAAFDDGVEGELSLRREESDPRLRTSDSPGWQWNLESHMATARELHRRRPYFWKKLRVLGPTPAMLAEANAILGHTAEQEREARSSKPEPRRIAWGRERRVRLQQGRAPRRATNHRTRGSHRGAAPRLASRGGDSGDGSDPPSARAARGPQLAEHLAGGRQ